MNERIKELAEQTDITMTNVYACYEKHIERFAELVRQDLYQVIGKSVIEQINSAVQMEREACAKLIEDFEPESFYLGQLKNAAEAIRARSKHEQD